MCLKESEIKGTQTTGIGSDAALPLSVSRQDGGVHVMAKHDVTDMRQGCQMAKFDPFLGLR